ncbi:hypothetical protein ACFQY0_16510 [Haloferula chungangensis]|uniref:Uncharacterized protein n=1 Tax=Haloferula chungangensis TaxID=1048331 RepID=A0ABW2LB27_9BACT
MIRLSLLLATTLPLLADDQVKPDLLRLTNGELEGHFAGLDANGVLRWEREDGIAPMEFKTDKVRQIVLRGGHPIDAGKDAAHIELVNGDRIPARVVSLENDSLTIGTPMAGRIELPRDAVVRVAPNPFGGRLIYAGPFSEEGWEIYRPADDFPELEENEDEDEDAEPAKERKPSWNHRGSKWYFSGGRDALRSPIGMPDEAILRFELEWRNRPSIAIAFHADFQPPVYPPADEDEKLSEEEQQKLQKQRDDRRRSSQHLADYFGNAYVLTLRSSYAQLQQCGFNEDGEPFLDQIRSSTTNFRFDDTGIAVFELRCNRKKGSVSLFVNDEFSMQWDLNPGIDWDDDEEPTTKGYGGLGDGIGFQTLGSDTPVRISDIIVAEWNGMPDSARSLKSEAFDVVLLTNGTDRFSGKIKTIIDGKLTLENRYAPLEIPLEEIAEIHLAENSQREIEDSSDRRTRVHFQPIGRISGVPGVTSNTTMSLNSPLLQKLNLDLTSAVVLEFQSGSSFLNYWDEEL